MHAAARRWFTYVSEGSGRQTDSPKEGISFEFQNPSNPSVSVRRVDNLGT